MPNLLTGNASIAAHVLIVENDPVQCLNIEELLVNWGYEVSVATATIGEADHLKLLRDGVLQKMHEHDFQIALIDMRLENDESKEDNSGQKLAEELLAKYPYLQVIMRSGYQEPRPPDDWKSIEKGAGTENLKSLMEDVLAGTQSQLSESGVIQWP